MMKVMVLLADGFEEIEAISVIDVLRRAEIEVFAVGIDSKFVKGANNIIIQTDVLLDDILNDDLDAFVLPGGWDGVHNICKSEKAISLLKKVYDSNKLIAAICAAPYVLYKAGILSSQFTCYPSVEENMDTKSNYISNKNVVVDKNIISSRGPGTSMEFSLELVKTLKGEKVYLDLKKALLF